MLNREEFRNEKTSREAQAGSSKPRPAGAARAVETAENERRADTVTDTVYDRLNSVTVYHEKRLPNVLG